MYIDNVRIHYINYNNEYLKSQTDWLLPILKQQQKYNAICSAFDFFCLRTGTDIEIEEVCM